ncbi:MAG: YceD family protein [Dolichospermum sp.]
MDAIFIPQLSKAPERTEEIQVQEFLPGLETLTPVRGIIQVKHQGNYLEVSTQAEAIITCTCNRCLQQYNHRITVDASELIWLEAETQPDEDWVEREVALEDLVETLDPNGYFQPLDWLYEQFCLAIPPRQLCDQNCQGIPFEADPEPQKPLDHRWAGLQSLKEHLQN